MAQGEDQSRAAPKSSTVVKSRAFYSDSDSSDADHNGAVIGDDVFEMDEDHELLLKSCIPLLQSRNSGVRFLKYNQPPDPVQKLISSLVFRSNLGGVIGGAAILPLSSSFSGRKGCQTFGAHLTKPSWTTIRRPQQHCHHVIASSRKHPWYVFWSVRGTNRTCWSAYSTSLNLSFSNSTFNPLNLSSSAILSWPSWRTLLLIQTYMCFWTNCR